MFTAGGGSLPAARRPRKAPRCGAHKASGTVRSTPLVLHGKDMGDPLGQCRSPYEETLPSSATSAPRCSIFFFFSTADLPFEGLPASAGEIPFFPPCPTRDRGGPGRDLRLPWPAPRRTSERWAGFALCLEPVAAEKSSTLPSGGPPPGAGPRSPPTLPRERGRVFSRPGARPFHGGKSGARKRKKTPPPGRRRGTCAGSSSAEVSAAEIDCRCRLRPPAEAAPSKRRRVFVPSGPVVRSLCGVVQGGGPVTAGQMGSGAR